MVRRMHAQAERGTLETWCEAVKPSNKAQQCYWHEEKHIQWWATRDICPRCRRSEISNCAEKPFKLPSGFIKAIKQIYCFDCERAFSGPWQLQTHQGWFS